jgi:hypothetical protein
MYLLCYLFVSSFVTEHTRYSPDTVEIHTNSLLLPVKLKASLLSFGRCPLAAMNLNTRMQDNFAYGSETNSKKGYESRWVPSYHAQAYPKLITTPPKLITIAPGVIINTPKVITDFLPPDAYSHHFLTANYIQLKHGDCHIIFLRLLPIAY